MNRSSRIFGVNGFLLVSSGCQIPDLQISIWDFERKFGFECLIASIGMDFGINKFRITLIWVSWIDLLRSKRYLYGSDYRIGSDQKLMVKSSRQERIQPADLLQPYFRCLIVYFLILPLWRILRVIAILMRIDPISLRRGFGSSNFWPIWKPRAFKDRGNATNWSHISSLLINFALFSHLRFILSGLCGFFSLILFSVSPCETMTQGSMLRKDSVEKSLGAVVSRLRIKIPSFDNSALIKGYAKTMIGRCMNPRKQDMKGLLLMFPRICQVEGRVAGADLGLGRFQIDFDEEEDIVEVLKMEPFHFDGWMVSLVRWKPSVDPSYPSTLTFRVRVLGIPIEYWAYPTFKSIGDALGKVVDVDLDGGRVQVIIDGFKPLCFETIIEFDSGETLVSLRYERLYGYCSYCFSLCHDVEHCEKKYGIRAQSTHASTGSDGAGTHNWSYKGAVAQDRQSQHGSEGKGKGIAIEKVREGERIEPSNSKATGFGKGKQSRFQGEGSSRNKRFTNYAQFNDHRFNEQKKLKAKTKEATKVKVVDSDEAQAVQVVQTEAFKPKKIVRKSLIFEDEARDLSVQHSETKEITNTDNREAQAGPEVPQEKVSPQNDLDMGDLSLDLSGVTTDADLERDQPEEAGFVVEDKESDLDEDNVSDSAMLPSLEQVTSDAGEDVFERLEEEMRTVEEDAILVANSDQGAEASKVNDKGKGKEGTVAKKKTGRGLVLPGVTTRKRLVQALVLPRKRQAPKGGTNPGDDKFPPNHGPDKGGPGSSQASQPAS